MTDSKRDPRRENEPTATEEMAERYRNGARIVPVTRDPDESEPTGLPPGMHDDHRSPVAPK